MDCHLQQAILVRMNEARAQDGAEGAIAKKQTAPQELFRELLVGLAGSFRVKKRVIVVDRLA